MSINLFWLFSNTLWIAGLALSLSMMGLARSQNLSVNNSRCVAQVYSLGQLLTLIGLLFAGVLWVWPALIVLWMLITHPEYSHRAFNWLWKK
jgi:hypothetical protein